MKFNYLRQVWVPYAKDRRVMMAMSETSTIFPEVFRFWSRLTADQKRQLEEQVSKFNVPEIEQLKQSPEFQTSTTHWEPAEVMSLKSTSNADFQTEAWSRGKSAIQSGKVAVLTVAGGSGTRLGFPKPKGLFPIAPLSGKTFFQIQAETLLSVCRHFEIEIPWILLTSEETHEETALYFESHQFFGLNHIHLIQQHSLPMLHLDGKVALRYPWQVAVAPNGHGGAAQALVESGLLNVLKNRGVTTLSYVQIDNPLARLIDPIFIGEHLGVHSEVSTKVVRKRSVHEKVGVFCRDHQARLHVVEYMNLPPELTLSKDEFGMPIFNAGNTAMHLWNLDFIHGMVPNLESALRPHKLRKTVPQLDDSGRPIEGLLDNGYKFERFIFDLIPQAQRTLLMEVDRREEFSPVKNASGTDSVETARAQILERGQLWLNQHIQRAPLAEISPQVAWHPYVLKPKASWTFQPTENPVYIGDEPPSVV